MKQSGTMLSLRCHNQACRRPWAHVYNGVLAVESRHEGRTHHNAINLHVLLKMMLGSYHQNGVIIDYDRMEQMLEEIGVPLVQPLFASVVARPDE